MTKIIIDFITIVGGASGYGAVLDTLLKIQWNVKSITLIHGTAKVAPITLGRNQFTPVHILQRRNNFGIGLG